MYERAREVCRHRAVLPAEAWKLGREMIERHALDHLVAGPPRDDDEPTLDMLGEGQPATRPPCGGSCQRFGVQGCHSPRCCVGAE